jgi:CheY-like chemotaxis protein
LSKEPCKVLVVDEDRDNADTSVVLLQLWGHESDAAYSAEDAVAKAQTLDPDVILVDLGRHVVQGFDIAAELRRYCPEAKLVALATFTAGDIVRRTRAAGFQNVLFKPAPAKKLQEVVDTECAATNP